MGEATNGGRALSCLFSLSWNKPRLRRTMAEVRTSKNVIWCSSSLTFFKVCHHGRWSCNRRTFQELLSCGVRRKMVCWGGVRPRPGPRLPPLEGGGRRPRNGPRVVLPPVRKSPVSRTICTCCRARTHAGRIVGTGVGQGVRRCMAPMPPLAIQFLIIIWFV